MTLRSGHLKARKLLSGAMTTLPQQLLICFCGSDSFRVIYEYKPRIYRSKTKYSGL